MPSLLGPQLKRRPPRTLKALHAPRAEELAYLRAILPIVRQAQALIRDVVMPALPGLLAAGGATRADDLSDDLAALFERLLGLLAGQDGAARRAAVEMLERVQRRHLVAFDAAYGGVPGLNPLTAEPWLVPVMRVAATENAELIKGLSSDMVAEVRGIVTRGVVGGVRVEALAKEIAERFAVSESRAALIASDQVLKYHGHLQQQRQADAGITEYTWSTSQDERVRPGHRALNGQVCKWSSPPIDDPRKGTRHHPGQAIRCRCVSVPIVPEFDE